MYLAPAAGVACLLGVLAAAANARFVHFTINGDAVTGHEFLRTVGAAFLVLGTLALAIAYSIWQERSRTRWLILGYWAALLALEIGLGFANSGTAGAALAVIHTSPFLVVVGWYLFGKANVVDYFRALERAEAARAGRDIKPSGGGA
ncbi:MAG TPA: hypothetical protein VH116_03935 [Gemmatimonadales bacterium]|jgi:hypothetical protein|nr:hypothetical protein [Gemmatimonadales bacterium]